MWVDFEMLPPNAKIWIYQASRLLSSEEQTHAMNKGRAFVESWDSHGERVAGSCQIFHQSIFVIAADQNQTAVSGCSTDKSVHLVKGLEKELGIDFFDRLSALLIDEQGKIQFKRKGDLSEADLKSLRVLNLSANTKADLEGAWFIPAQESWLAS